MRLWSSRVRPEARPFAYARDALLAVLCALAILGASFTVAVPGAVAAGPNAVMTPVGWDTNTVARGDDTSALVVDLPFTMNWNGTVYTQVYINMNGNCTFGSAYNGYNPSTTLAATGRNILAPFWADVDTRNTATGQVTYSNTAAGSLPQVDGHDAFFVNWINVARYNNSATPLNSFQLVIIDRSDTGAGNFDFMYNYDQITWDIATAASTHKARAGWGFAGAGFELPGSGATSGSTSPLLDSSAAATSLIKNSLNSGGQLGRYVFQVRNGAAPNWLPVVTTVDRDLEGNAADSYVGYTGVGDAAATDSDGTVVSLTHDRPDPLPLGLTTVTWTATDDRGGVGTATQTILVQDTTAPTNPALSSPSHATGVWSTTPLVTVEALGAADVCTGVDGFSYAWSQNAPQAPDSVVDPTATVPVPPQNVTVSQTTFPDAIWPAQWTRVLLAGAGAPTTYLRSQNTRASSTYAAELWTNVNGTRRTFGFYQDVDLSSFTAATVTYDDYTTGLDIGTDYTRLEYSTDGGGSWASLRNTAANTGWTSRSYSLPVGGTVRIRFSGSVDRTNEFCDWDNIVIAGTTPAQPDSYHASDTSTLADGTWYFNLHTADHAGNWSAPASLGPFLIDTTAPVTTSNAPAGWNSTPVSLALTPTDAGQVTGTWYSLNGTTWTAYGGPIPVTAEGTTTVWYYSADAAGHTEAVKSSQVRVDTLPPTAPGSVVASTTTTTTVDVSWVRASDATSGIAYYGIYRDGVLVGTSASLAYADSGLTSGQTYVYTVTAFDQAGNESAAGGPTSVTMPIAVLWMTISDSVVDMGPIAPDTGISKPAALSVSVGGIGASNYTLSCSGADFINDDPLSLTPTMPVSVLSFVTHGHISTPALAFGTGSTTVSSSAGASGVWVHTYVFDYWINVPYDYEPGSYVAGITYTVVSD